MKYRNPEIPEGINKTPTHPLKEFILLSGGVLVVLFTTLVMLGWFGGTLARYIPFDAEVTVAQSYEVGQDIADEHPLQIYLQSLSQRVAQAMTLTLPIQLHYIDSDFVNAFATLGGHVMLFRGLLEKLPHENALVMLMAHEFAHIKHRDPIVSLGSNVAVSVGQTALLGQNAQVFGTAGLLTTLHFSRRMESQADQIALSVLHKVYGHVNGATDLFSLFLDSRPSKESLSFLSSHPLDAARIQAIETQAQVSQWKTNQATTPLPAKFKQWLKENEEKN